MSGVLWSAAGAAVGLFALAIVLAGVATVARWWGYECGWQAGYAAAERDLRDTYTLAANVKADRERVRGRRSENN
jgi:hypothetical protein